MTSIIKVDQIQTLAGTAPTAADLGINVTGSVLQVVNTIMQDNVAIGANSNGDVMSASITPKYASSKIKINIWGTYYSEHNGASTNNSFQVFRNGAVLPNYPWPVNGNTSAYIHYKDTAVNALVFPPFNVVFLDSPSTTSSVSYTFRLVTLSGPARIYSGASILLEEIAG